MDVDVKPGLNRRVESKAGRTKVMVGLPMVTEVKASWSGRSPKTRKLGVEKEDARMYAERPAAVSAVAPSRSVMSVTSIR